MYVIQGKNSTRAVPVAALSDELIALLMSWTASLSFEVSVGRPYNIDNIVDATARWKCWSRFSGFDRSVEANIVASFVKIG